MITLYSKYFVIIQNNMKAIIYLRVSTDEQASSGLGLAAQLAACQKSASLLGITDVQVFTDAAVSGSVPVQDRKGLTAALAALRKGDFFIVAKRDRIARDMDAALSVERSLKARKAVLISSAGEGTGTGVEDTSALMQKRMFQVFAEIERQMIKDRTRAALQTKKAKGELIGSVPYGFKLSSDGVHLDVCEREQEIIALVKELRAKGFSGHAIVAHLNDHNIQTRTGHLWSRTQITRILEKV
jgi:DNA invertase Pin-like site-specific DNA recombinase